MTSETGALIYRERVNAINGEPGGGKTWVALKACAETIAAGQHTIMIDLEDHATSTVARLRALGATDENIREGFHYVKPDRPLSPEAMEYLEQMVVELDVALVVIDSVGELMSLQGVKPNDDDAVAALYRAIPRRLAGNGPAVLLVDHVPKNNTDTPLYAIGSQRKRAAIDGASFMVTTIKGFAAGVDGVMKLVTAKDRLGNFVTGQAAAMVNVSSSDDGSNIAIVVVAPEVSAGGAQRQTHNMEKVSRFLEGCDDRRATRKQIKEGSGVGDRHLNTVLQQMVGEGLITDRSEGVGKPRWITSAREFRDFQDPKLEPPMESVRDDEF